MSTGERDMVIGRSLNKTVDRMFTVGKRAIGQEANISQGDIGSRMRKVKTGTGGLQVSLIATSRWFAASYAQFNMSQSSTGAAFTPWRGHREKIAHGFIATLSSGHQSIFTRIGPKRMMTRGRYAGQMRQAIHDVGWGPNVAREMVRPGKRPEMEIQSTAAITFNTEFARQYELLVMKAKAKYGL